MNENPEGTPNPLTNGSNPAPVAPAPMAGATPPEQPAPIAPAPTVAPAPAAPTPAEEPAAVAKPVKKNSKAAFIAAIVFLVVALIAGVAAIFAFNLLGGPRNDAVPAALAKLFDKGGHELVALDGTAELSMSGDDAFISSIDVKFKSSIDSKDKKMGTNMEVNALLGDYPIVLSLDIKEPTGDFSYIKLKGFAGLAGTLLNGFASPFLCADETNAEECADAFSGILDSVEELDDQWIQVPNELVEGLMSNLDSGAIGNNQTQCLIDAAGKLGEFGSDFAKMYKENSFVAYSTENLSVKKKQDPLYRLSFKADELAGFINSMNNSGFMNELLACVGGKATNQAVTANELSEVLDVLPELYVEINDNNDFTRVYLTKSLDGLSVTTDISISYPSEIIVTEPTGYTTLDEISKKLQSMTPTLPEDLEEGFDEDFDFTF